MNTKVLVTGANGFLGQHLVHYLASKGYDVIATGRGERRITSLAPFLYVALDLTQQDAVNTMMQRLKPDVVIHVAAMSKPDECNNDQKACVLHNVCVTNYLATAAKETNAYFIYTSTDFIFGEDGPHSETAIPDPLNFYGESKWRAEQLVHKQLPGTSAIMRPVFIYGPSLPGMRPSFLHWVKNNLVQGNKIKVVSDQQRTPTYVYDICTGLEQMFLQKVTGDFHLAGKDILSPYQMALTVADVLHLDKSLIEEVTSETFPEPVKRAKHSGLKIDKARAMLHYDPVSFEEGARLSLL